MPKIMEKYLPFTFEEEDYISLTDMVRNIENGVVLIEKWLRNKNTIEFMIQNTDIKKRNTGLKYKLSKL